MNWGVIRAIGTYLAPCGHVFRLLVLKNCEDWAYIYVGASNYPLRVNDVVTWNEHDLYWHTSRRSVRFDLLQSGVKT